MEINKNVRKFLLPVVYGSIRIKFCVFIFAIKYLRDRKSYLAWLKVTVRRNIYCLCSKRAKRKYLLKNIKY